jgi:hypothetical protein
VTSGGNHAGSAPEPVSSARDIQIHHVLYSPMRPSLLCESSRSATGSVMPETPLASCIEDRANVLFSSQYVYCKTGRFPYMEHFWLARPPHAHLAMCLRAVSLACLSIELCSPEILQMARQRYSLALNLTRAALQCPHIAKHNATLLTVLLLYLYEKTYMPASE